MIQKRDIGYIIRRWGADYSAKHNPPAVVRRAFSHMAQCRTAALGGHVDLCSECGQLFISYNSCRDRHCPKCQNKERLQWTEDRKEEIIPGMKYFHVVFTVPACLNTVAMHNQAVFYSCMFKAAWSTLKSFFGNKNLTGGMTALLHTWGSALSYHPHLHCIVPGGGIYKKGRWHSLDSCSGKSDFLFPVQALSNVFRARFVSMLSSALKKEGRFIPEDIRKKAFQKAWVVYSRPPAKGVNQVVEYIARYAFRAAITNSRIINVTDDGKVTFDYKDYRHGGMHKSKTVKAVDFLMLLAQHILPQGFFRIRHYGILSPSCRDKLREVQSQMGGTPVPRIRSKKPWLQICSEHGWKVGMCPDCGCQTVTIAAINPSRAPPTLHNGSSPNKVS